MAYRSRRGVGDWFEPSCPPGSPGCVPHAYCYVPGMVTPDCIASFGQGVKEIAGAAGQAAGGVLGSAVKGVVSGTLNPPCDPDTDPSCGEDSGVPSWVWIAALVGVGAMVLMQTGRRR